MSAENVELAKQMNQAYIDGDLEEIRKHCREDVVLVEWPESPDSNTFVGHEGIAKAFEHWHEPFDHVLATPLDYVDAGDRVLATTRLDVKGSGSGLETSFESWTVTTFENGLATRLEFFIDRDKALRAAGLADNQQEDA